MFAKFLGLSRPVLAKATPGFPKNPTLSKRYAQALFNVSQEGESLEGTFNDLKWMETMVQESPDFRHLLKFPGFEPKDRQAAMKDLAKLGQFSEATQNLVSLLIENGRFAYLPAVIQDFTQMYHGLKGILSCEVVSAHPLKAKEKKQVQEAIKARRPEVSELMVDFSQDPSLLAGFVVRFDSQILDFSARSKLDSLKKVLMQPL